MLRYRKSNPAVCSRKSASVCGRPASTSATVSPASVSRFAAHPPEAPAPTITASYVFCTSTPADLSPPEHWLALLLERRPPFGGILGGEADRLEIAFVRDRPL